MSTPAPARAQPQRSNGAGPRPQQQRNNGPHPANGGGDQDDDFSDEDDDYSDDGHPDDQRDRPDYDYDGDDGTMEAEALHYGDRADEVPDPSDMLGLNPARRRRGTGADNKYAADDYDNAGGSDQESYNEDEGSEEEDYRDQDRGHGSRDRRLPISAMHQQPADRTETVSSPRSLNRAPSRDLTRMPGFAGIVRAAQIAKENEDAVERTKDVSDMLTRRPSGYSIASELLEEQADQFGLEPGDTDDARARLQRQMSSLKTKIKMPPKFMAAVQAKARKIREALEAKKKAGLEDPEKAKQIEADQEKERKYKEQQRRMAIAKLPKSEQLMYAVRENNYEQVCLLLAQSQEAQQALGILAEGDEEARAQLCDFSYREPGMGETVLHVATRLGQYNIMREFLADRPDDQELKELDVNRMDFFGYTPLMLAAQHGRVLFCEMLLESTDKKKQSQIYLGDHDSWTALMFAADRGHWHVVEYLCSKNADITATSHLGETALHRACINGHLLVIKHLLTKTDSDINYQNKEGNTPLILAAYYGRLEVIRYLILSYADTGIKNKDGNNAFTVLPSAYAVENYKPFEWWYDPSKSTDRFAIMQDTGDRPVIMETLPPNLQKAKKVIHQYVVQVIKDTIKERDQKTNTAQDVATGGAISEEAEAEQKVLLKKDMSRFYTQEYLDNEKRDRAKLFLTFGLQDMANREYYSAKVMFQRGKEKYATGDPDLEKDFEKCLQEAEAANREVEEKKSAQKREEEEKAAQQATTRYQTAEKFMNQKRYAEAVKWYTLAKQAEPGNEVYRSALTSAQKALKRARRAAAAGAAGQQDKDAGNKAARGSCSFFSFLGFGGSSKAK